MPKAITPKDGLTDTWGRANRSLECKACEKCGDVFRPARATAKFCSRKCSWSKNGGHNKKDQTWWVNSRGYIEGRVWENGVQRQVKQHRLVMEQSIGRKLTPNEDVHHINGNKEDNSIENLSLMTKSQHATLSNKLRALSKAEAGQ